jgi:cytochrome c oxidase subunit 4
MDVHDTEHAHPGERTYVKVALWLGVITALEISISYMHIKDWEKVVSLLVLMLIKFVGVVAYFMHLKFDHPLLRKPFVTGMAFAGSIYTVVLLNLFLHKG